VRASYVGTEGEGFPIERSRPLLFSSSLCDVVTPFLSVRPFPVPGLSEKEMDPFLLFGTDALSPLRLSLCDPCSPAHPPHA